MKRLICLNSNCVYHRFNHCTREEIIIDYDGECKYLFYDNSEELIRKESQKNHTKIEDRDNENKCISK